MSGKTRCKNRRMKGRKEMKMNEHEETGKVTWQNVQGRPHHIGYPCSCKDRKLYQDLINPINDRIENGLWSPTKGFNCTTRRLPKVTSRHGRMIHNKQVQIECDRFCIFKVSLWTKTCAKCRIIHSGRVWLSIDDYCYARYPVGSDFYMAKAQNKRQLMLDDEKQQGEKEGQRITK